MGVSAMAKIKKKQTPNQIAYAKQVKRIKQFIRRAEKRGYQFTENVLPKQPKRITQASIRKLAKLTPEKLYQKAVYGGEASEGEIVKGTEGVKLERKVRAQKAAQTRKYRLKEPTQEPTNTPDFIPPENISEDASFFENTVISMWYANLEQYSNGEAYNLLRSWLGNTIRINGKHNTAIMLEEGAANGYIVTWETVYKSDNAILYIGYMLDYLPDQGIMYKDEVLDKVEFMKRMGDALEQDEDWEYPL